MRLTLTDFFHSDAEKQMALDILNKFQQDFPDITLPPDFTIDQSIVNIGLEHGLYNVPLSYEYGQKYAEIELEIKGGIDDVDGLEFLPGAKLVISQKDGVYIAGSGGIKIAAVELDTTDDSLQIGLGTLGSPSEVAGAFDLINRSGSLSGELDLKLLKLGGKISVKNKQIVQLEGKIAKGISLKDLILEGGITVRYKNDLEAFRITGNTDFYPAGVGEFDLGTTIQIFSRISDEYAEYIDENLSYLEVRQHFIDSVQSQVNDNGIPFSIALAINVNRLKDDPSNSFDPSNATLEDVINYVQGGPITIVDNSSEAFVEEVQNSLSTSFHDSEIISTAVFPFRIIDENGAEEIVLINPEKLKLQRFQSDYADAQIDGIIISETGQTIVNDDGTVYIVTEKLIEDTQGNRYTATESRLSENSAQPTNGIISEQIILRINPDGTMSGLQHETVFLKDGLTHRTTQFQGNETQNPSIKQDIIRTDLNGNQVVSEGPHYIIPSSGLTQALQAIGGTAGTLLANQLTDDNVYQQVFYSAVFKTIGEHFGSVGAYLATGSNLEALVNVFKGAEIPLNGEITVQLTDDIFDTFASNLQAGTAGLVSGIIVSEVGDALGIEGTIGGEIFDVAAGALTTGLISGGIDIIFNNLDASVYAQLLNREGIDLGTKLSDLDGNFSVPGIDNPTVGDYVQLQLANALAAYAGNRLAGELIEPESEQAAILGSLGSGFAIYAVNAAAAAAAGATSAVATIGNILSLGVTGPIGIVIGTFIGQVAGTFLGNLFGSEETPSSWARLEYNHDDEYIVHQTWASGGAGTQLAASMGAQVVAGVNSIIEATHGTLRTSAAAHNLQIGMHGDEFRVVYAGEESKSFGSAADAINYAAFKLLKSYDLVGGHAVVMRAWHNSDATNIHEFKDDIEVAEAFQAYLANPAGILALMMDQPESDTAQAWAAILQRAAELELHLPHEKDLDGGWGEILNAQGIDPELIPSLEGDTLVLTDPVTGEETVLHHIIGPGYEIVRIEGTDGDDIIHVSVDGPSISYVEAGNGDDFIEGSDQADILVGGGGHDIIIGNDGNDWLHGGSGNDQIDGGAGEDLIVGADHDDILEGGADTDQIYGNGGDDILRPGMGTVDYLHGGTGNDTLEGNWNDTDGSITVARLYGGHGDDTLILFQDDIANGAQGNDTVQFVGSNNIFEILRDQGHDTVVAASGHTNIIRFNQMISPNELFFRQSGQDLEILVLGEKQSVTVQDFYAATNQPTIFIEAAHEGAAGLYSRQAILEAVAKSATIPNGPTGEYNFISDADLAAGENYFEGATNPWTLAPHHQWGADGAQSYELLANRAIAAGGTGNDVLFTDLQGSGDRLYAGDSGDDVLRGSGNQVDIMSGGLGNDLLIAGSNNDLLYGGYGNDEIHGQNDNDTIYGGAGNDIIYSGHGEDYVEGNDGDDFIQDYFHANVIHGGAGNDTIDLHKNIDNDAAYGGTGNDIIKAGFGDDVLEGNAGDDIIYAGGGDDWILGGSGDDQLRGGFGFDIMNAGDGNDNLQGNSEDDDLYGNNGHDILNGGYGNDRLFGGLGDDTYFYDGFNRYVSLNKSGNTGHVQLNSGLNVTTAMTLSMTFRSHQTQTDDTLIHYRTNGMSDALNFYNNPYSMWLTIGGEAVNTGYAGFQGTEWHTLTVTWDSASGEAKLYDDGQLVFSHFFSSGITLDPNGTVLIGQYSDYMGLHDLDGDLRQFTVWDHVLDVNEIANGVDLSDAVHDFQFSEGQGAIVTNHANNEDANLIGDFEWPDFEQPSVDLSSYASLNKSGNTGHVQLGGGLDVTTAMTLSMTFRSHQAQTDDILIHYRTNGGDALNFYNNPYSMWLTIGGEAVNTGYAGFQGTEWHTLTVTWNGANGEVKLYDGGQLVFSHFLSPGVTLDPNGTLLIGQYSDFVGIMHDFAGDLSHFTVWDHVLSANEIANGADLSDAVHDLHFNDGQGAIVTNNANNEDANLIGNFEWVSDTSIISDEDHALKLGSDIISDEGGNDTIAFGNNIVGSDVTYLRDLSDQDDLIIHLLNSEIATVENQFSDSSIENISFSDGTVMSIDDVEIIMEGDALNNTLSGTASIDVLYGFEGDDALYGAAGEDRLFGGAGADGFYFEGETAFDGSLDIIEDFSEAQGDTINVADILSDFGYDPLTDAIADWIEITSNGTHSTVSVDRDGAGTGYHYTDIVEIRNVADLDIDNLTTV